MELQGRFGVYFDNIPSLAWYYFNFLSVWFFSLSPQPFSKWVANLKLLKIIINFLTSWDFCNTGKSPICASKDRSRCDINNKLSKYNCYFFWCMACGSWAPKVVQNGDSWHAAQVSAGTVTVLTPILFLWRKVPAVCHWLLTTQTVAEIWDTDLFCLSATCLKSFLNNQCRRISILLPWPQNEVSRRTKGYAFKVVSLCLWNKSLFSLIFVGPGNKSHFWTKDTNPDIWDGQLSNLMGKCEYPAPNPL